MLKQPCGKPTEVEFVSKEELVPKDHLLQKFERVVGFSLIRERVAGHAESEPAAALAGSHDLSGDLG